MLGFTLLVPNVLAAVASAVPSAAASIGPLNTLNQWALAYYGMSSRQALRKKFNIRGKECTAFLIGDTHAPAGRGWCGGREGRGFGALFSLHTTPLFSLGSLALALLCTLRAATRAQTFEKPKKKQQKTKKNPMLV